MGKYDDIFNSFFNLEAFNGDEEKLEAAREAFSDIMDRFKDKHSNDEGEVDPSDIDGIVDDISSKLKDNPMGVYSIENDKVEDIIKKYDLAPTDISIDETPIEGFEGFVIINEIWTNENSSYMISQNYPLTKQVFETKQYDIQLKIVDAIIERGIFNKSYMSYLNSLKKKDAKNIYNNLIEIAVEKENYEAAAEYRDILEEI